jgi:hypothetical protein
MAQQQQTWCLTCKTNVGSFPRERSQSGSGGVARANRRTWRSQGQSSMRIAHGNMERSLLGETHQDSGGDKAWRSSWVDPGSIDRREFKSFLSLAVLLQEYDSIFPRRRQSPGKTEIFPVSGSYSPWGHCPCLILFFRVIVGSTSCHDRVTCKPIWHGVSRGDKTAAGRSPCRQPQLKQPYGCLWGGRHQGVEWWGMAGPNNNLGSPWIPHEIRACCHVELSHQTDAHPRRCLLPLTWNFPKASFWRG